MENGWVNLSETDKTVAASAAGSSTKKVTWKDRVGEGRELFKVVDDSPAIVIKPQMPTVPSRMAPRPKPNREQWTRAIHNAGYKKALPMKTQNISLTTPTPSPTSKDSNQVAKVESPGGFTQDIGLDDIPLGGFGTKPADSHPEEQAALAGTVGDFNQEIPYKKIIKRPTRSVHQIISQRGAGWRVLARAPPTESTSFAMSESLRSTLSTGFTTAPMSELTAFLPPNRNRPRTGKRVFAQTRLHSHSKESTIFPGRVFQETMQVPESAPLGWRSVFPPSAILRHSRCYTKDSAANTRTFLNTNGMPPAGCMTVR
eukprot:TRINITY_DN12090_c0_g2_i1.p1 TRINITY_DN12090_c0_g2~~TRINITY_DN12090_c0_g2_i1.p1  ORF type:complete len:314 (+),score=55.06 TRINITY_DN12090_c0_g2_i1:63-1004(+)